MNVMPLVAWYVDGKKRELLEYLHDRGAVDADHAVHLGIDVRPSILRALTSRNVVRQTASGRYFLDVSRIDEAYGASNRFILTAMGAFLLAFFIIMIW